ncbi:MAG: hypothetical protein KA296_04540 [Marinobacter sp.]|nr:hypothetical protein [Marinobacter sp.]
MTDIYAFGSIVSGDFDDGSDTDILVIEAPCDDNLYPTDWSVYTRERINELYRRGTLFSWHIHLEATPLYSASGRGYLESLGPPAPYTQAKNEIAALKSLAEVALSELAAGTPSSIYELGILGVALRDIGMAASKPLNGNFCFSKKAPYFLKGIELPIKQSDYRHLINCRRATTRGHQVDYDHSQRLQIVALTDVILAWCGKVFTQVSGCEK